VTIGNRLVQIYTTDIDGLLQIAESQVTRRFAAKEKEKYERWIGSCPSFHNLLSTDTGAKDKLV
jgi:hypothetical protein